LQYVQDVITDFWAPFPQPVSVPACGFSNEKCSITNQLLIAGGVLLFLLICISLFYGRYKWFELLAF